MKILILAPYSSPIVQRLFKALNAYTEHEVWVASFNVETDLKNKIIGLGKLNSFLDYFKINKINKIIKKINPDIVHAHIINHYGLLALLQKKPLLVALWGSDVMVAPNKGSLMKRKFFTLVNGLVAKKANLLHTSSKHILNEMVSKYGSDIQSKINVFYWGFPVEEPNTNDYLVIQSSFLKEYGIHKEDNLVVATRGLADIYAPENMIKIIEELSKNNQLKVVVLRGFANDIEVSNFKEKIQNFSDKVVFINRLLSSNELYVLYSQAKYHISIPTSDALGGGVIEPLLMGSYPILSNIPPYQNFILENSGYIINDYSVESINILCQKIRNEELQVNIDIIKQNYSAQSIVSRFNDLYLMTLR
ncbi:glycosyl transferase family 1 [Acinetobacter sp. ANC 7200]|uniref:glycosyltransferase n=1 Tax=Acinetobacter amyesii TaxID=2942470 RepID=UPI0020BFEFC1|nr:glycosyltransferase [Acinetobacter amyesii]MCL6244587.1 glycosyl transferase family 1 [Acinetobacter amyesii]